jgi:hypothetical protein
LITATDDDDDDTCTYDAGVLEYLYIAFQIEHAIYYIEYLFSILLFQMQHATFNFNSIYHYSYEW